MELANFGRRYLAFALDALFLELLGAWISSPLLSSLESGFRAVIAEGDGASAVLSPFGSLLMFHLLLWASLWSWYFTCFHWIAGRTPGKKLLGLWVIHRDGKQINLLVAFLRLWISLLAGAMTLGLSYTWAGWDRWRQGWHDKCFDTVVVRKIVS